jgi:hypothetical protein
MKNIILSIFIILSISGPVMALDIYKPNGEKIDSANYLNMWPVQFKNKADAEAVASGLQNGQVFKDYDKNLYQVWYGNVEVTGVIVAGSMTEN